jgi:hypothetical protein
LEKSFNRQEFMMLSSVRPSLVSILPSLPLLIPGSAQSASLSKTDLRDTMDKLWEDHVTWTRLYIVSAAANLPEKEATAQRLLQNQTDIGNAIKHLKLTTDEAVAPSEGRLGCRYRTLRESARADSQNGRHAQRRNHEAISEQI